MSISLEQTFCLTEAIPLCSNKLYNIFRQYTTIYQHIDVIYSDYTMATCFDRKTVIISPIENIIKVQ